MHMYVSLRECGHECGQEAKPVRGVPRMCMDEVEGTTACWEIRAGVRGGNDRGVPPPPRTRTHYYTLLTQHPMNPLPSRSNSHG